MNSVLMLRTWVSRMICKLEPKKKIMQKPGISGRGPQKKCTWPPLWRMQFFRPPPLPLSRAVSTHCLEAAPCFNHTSLHTPLKPENFAAATFCERVDVAVPSPEELQHQMEMACPVGVCLHRGAPVPHPPMFQMSAHKLQESIPRSSVSKLLVSQKHAQGLKAKACVVLSARLCW